MTHTASGSKPGVPKGWLVPAVALVLILVAAAIGWLSRSIVIDFVAWWPLWLLLGGLAFFGRHMKLGRMRVAGLVPILATVALGVFLVGHIQGWGAMPSSSASLVGPASGSVTDAAMSARIEGRVDVVSAESGFLYTVVPIRTGGSTGLPQAVERTQGTAIAIDLEPVEDPGLYTFDGWSLGLDPAPNWNISLGGTIEADLSDTEIDRIAGRGEWERDSRADRCGDTGQGLRRLRDTGSVRDCGPGGGRSRGPR